VIADVVAGLSDEKCREFMALRTEFSKSSVKKYDAVLRSVCKDDHIRGMFVFAGAGRTSRFSGRIVQMQNLKKNELPDLDSARELVRDGDGETLELIYGDVQETLSQLIRTALIPESGQKFVVADFAAIEARVIAWIAGEEWRQKVFAEGGDIYCASASQMFKVPVVKHGINGHLRQKGKIAELALGYGGGTNALLAFGADKLGMTDEEMAETVDRWREASPHITALWRSLEQAAIRCIKRKRSTLSTVGGIRFDYEDPILWMVLPSGRRIAYWGADFGQNRWGNPSLSYWGTDQKTKKWSRLETWGGKLTENLVQATARDCLKESMLRLNAAGYDIRAHVHDEVIITAPMDVKVEDVAAVMGQPIEWAPGLLLRADGYECSSYRKD
jgi:DNA polymerase